MAGASSVVILSVVSVFVFIGVIVGNIVVSLIVERSSSALSERSAVDCIIDSVLRGVEG